jgi:hypothetical protein
MAGSDNAGPAGRIVARCSRKLTASCPAGRQNRDLRPGAGQAPAARIRASGQVVDLILFGSQGFTPMLPPDH